MNNTTEAYANSNNFTSSPANDLFFFLTKHSLLFPSSLSPPCMGRGRGVSLRAVSALRRATEGGTKRGYILPPHQVPLWLSAAFACASHLLPQDTSGARARWSVGGWGRGVFEIQPVSPCRTSRRCRCFCCSRLAGSLFQWMVAIIKTRRLQ